MGGGYSDLNVFFNENVKYYSKNGFTVISTNKIFEGCSDFQVITHTISFDPGIDPLYYNVLLYDGYNDINKGNLVFGYYYPRDVNQVARKVQIYYSLLAPDYPLVISFKTNTNMYNCYFGRLKKAGWDRAYNIGEYSFGPICHKSELEEAFKNLNLNRKIKVELGNVKTEIEVYKQTLIGEYYRFILAPSGNKSVLGCDCIVSLDLNTNEDKWSEAASSEGNNLIDHYYLKSVKGRFYDGIMMYVASDKEKHKTVKQYSKVLLLEFIDTTKKKIQIQRKDIEGYWWSEEPVMYKDEDSIVSALKEIQNKLENVNTILLDEKGQYKGPINVYPNGHKTYTRYSHEFRKANKPVTVFNSYVKTIGEFDSNFLTNRVDVYYLNHGGKQDIEPFLIVFYDDRTPKFRDAYHFTNSYNFEEWVKFKFEFKKEQGPNPGDDITQELKKKLDDKIKKIESLKCLDNLNLLRFMAYNILIDPEIPHTEKKEKVVPRPKVKYPETVAKKYTIEIILGSVGGGVFVISSAALYGVYWYNTTIKLLT